MARDAAFNMLQPSLGGNMVVGVPKHSELEPDYCLAKGNGSVRQDAA